MATRIEQQIAEITRLYELDQANPRMAVAPGDIPISYEAITPEWLTHILCKDVPGAKVVSCSLDVPDDGSSNRRRIFLTYNAEGQDAGLLASVFCKASFDLLNRIMLGVSDCARTEICFYSNVRPELEIEAPEGVFASYDPKAFTSIVMLKDLGGQVMFCDHRTEMSLERGLSQVRLLANYHARFYNDPRLIDGSLGLQTWPNMWGNQVENGMAEYTNKGFLAAKDVIPARLYARYDEIWPTTARSVELHKGRPQTLTHCDTHLKNWYIRGESDMGLTDWQVASSGHWSRDIAYAISTAHTIENRRLWEKELFAAYVDAMKENGVEMPPLDVAWDYFRQQLFSALAFWTVTLTPAPSQPEMQPKDVTLEFIKRISTAIDDHDAFDSFKREG